MIAFSGIVVRFALVLMVWTHGLFGCFCWVFAMGLSGFTGLVARFWCGLFFGLADWR